MGSTTSRWYYCEPELLESIDDDIEDGKAARTCGQAATIGASGGGGGDSHGLPAEKSLTKITF